MPNEPLKETPREEGWLVAVGFAYPFAMLIAFSSSRMGPLAFHPLFLPLPALLLAGAAIGLRKRMRLRWWAVAGFIVWLGFLVFAQFWIFAMAAASV